MKNIFFLALLSVCTLTATAQNQILRQNLQQPINEITVSGNCIIRLQKDTCNYVAYRVPADMTNPNVEALVKVEGNHLTTTEAANDKILIVGTTETSNYTFDIYDNALVLFNDNVHSKGHVTINANTNTTVAKPERDWTGLPQYGPTDRIYNSFHFGHAMLYSFEFNRLTTLTQNDRIMTSSSWEMSYSLYMDHHFATGLGLTILSNTLYTFDPATIVYPDFIDINPNTYDYMMANTTWNVGQIGMPIHAKFFPQKTRRTYFELDLVPYINLFKTATTTLTIISDNRTNTLTTTDDLDIPTFNANLRLSANFSGIGVYAETSLIPLNRTIINSSTLRSVQHFAFGIRFDIFDLLKD